MLPVGYASEHPTQGRRPRAHRRSDREPRHRAARPAGGPGRRRRRHQAHPAGHGHLHPAAAPSAADRPGVGDAARSCRPGASCSASAPDGWRRSSPRVGVPFAERAGRMRGVHRRPAGRVPRRPVRASGRHFSFGPVQVGRRPVGVPLIMGGNTPARACVAPPTAATAGSAPVRRLRRRRRACATVRALRSELDLTEPFRCYVRVPSGEPECWPATPRRGSTTSWSGPTSSGRPRAPPASKRATIRRRPLTGPRPGARTRLGIEASAIEECRRPAGLATHQLALVGHALVGRLAAEVARVELLEDDRRLPAGERLVPSDVARRRSRSSLA